MCKISKNQTEQASHSPQWRWNGGVANAKRCYWLSAYTTYVYSIFYYSLWLVMTVARMCSTHQICDTNNLNWAEWVDWMMFFFSFGNTFRNICNENWMINSFPNLFEYRCFDASSVAQNRKYLTKPLYWIYIDIINPNVVLFPSPNTAKYIRFCMYRQQINSKYSHSLWHK